MGALSISTCTPESADGRHVAVTARKLHPLTPASAERFEVAGHPFAAAFMYGPWQLGNEEIREVV
jgi:hypothetical protein